MEKTKWKWLLCLVLVSIFVWFLLKYVLVLFLPVVFAYIFTRLVLPVAEKMKKAGKKCHISCSSKTCRLTVFFAYLLFIGIFLFFIGTMGIRQFRQLLTNLSACRVWADSVVVNGCTKCDSLLGLSDGETFRNVSSFLSARSGSFWQESLSELPASLVCVVKASGRMGLVLIFSVLLTIMALANLERWYHGYRHSRFYGECHEIFQELTGAGLAYIRTQLIIMFCIAVLCSVGLFLMKNPYALPIAVVIAIVDALPVFGSGTIFLPWIVICAVNGRFFKAGCLLLLYAASQLVRQVLEPRLMGRGLEAEPAVMLMAVFVGLKLFSVSGVLLGPIAYLLIRVLMRLLASGEKKCYDKP